MWGVVLELSAPARAMARAPLHTGICPSLGTSGERPAGWQSGGRAMGRSYCYMGVWEVAVPTAPTPHATPGTRTRAR